MKCHSPLAFIIALYEFEFRCSAAFHKRPRMCHLLRIAMRLLNLIDIRNWKGLSALCLLGLGILSSTAFAKTAIQPSTESAAESAIRAGKGAISGSGHGRFWWRCSRRTDQAGSAQSHRGYE